MTIFRAARVLTTWESAKPLVVLTQLAIQHSAMHEIRPEEPKRSGTHVPEVSAPNWRWTLRLVVCSTPQRVCSWGFWAGSLRVCPTAPESLLVSQYLFPPKRWGCARPGETDPRSYRAGPFFGTLD